MALLALPWALLAVLPATIRGGLFLDVTRTGMVLLQPTNPTLDLLVVLPIMLPVVGITFAALLIADSLNALPIIATLAGALFLPPVTFFVSPNSVNCEGVGLSGSA